MKLNYHFKEKKVFLPMIKFELSSQNYNFGICAEGEQNMPPLNMVLWPVDYFELKAVTPSRLRENFYLSLTT